MIKAAISFGLAAVAVACASAAPPPGAAIALRNADFEAAPRALERCPADWGCVLHADPDSYRFWIDTTAPAGGKQSFCMERVSAEPFATAQQTVPATALRGRKVRLSLSMRGEGFTGEGTGPIIIATRLGAVVTIGQNIARIDPEWRRYAVEMTVPREVEALEVGATLLGGGRACLDDVRLEEIRE